MGNINIEGELKEWLAAAIHDQWAHWTEYMMNNLTEENIERWRRQIKTPYEDLSEEEKDSDRDFADAYIYLLLTWLDQVLFKSLQEELRKVE